MGRTRHAHYMLSPAQPCQLTHANIEWIDGKTIVTKL